MNTREKAMYWWNDLFEYINPSGINKSALTEKYYGKERRYQSLTGSEIENIWQKENKTEGTQKEIILNRLKEQYKSYKNANVEQIRKKYYSTYASMRLFCLDCSLLSFAEIEEMEYNINQENS